MKKNNGRLMAELMLVVKSMRTLEDFKWFRDKIVRSLVIERKSKSLATELYGLVLRVNINKVSVGSTYNKFYVKSSISLMKTMIASFGSLTLGEVNKVVSEVREYKKRIRELLRLNEARNRLAI